MAEENINEILICDICQDIFNCDHEMNATFEGRPLKVPHCENCGWDNHQCKDKHGFLCSGCMDVDVDKLLGDIGL